jgi:hypothetical protein
VYDADECVLPKSSNEQRRPAVIGAPLPMNSPSFDRNIQTRTLELRNQERHAPGIFIPRLRMGTLRPQIAFGPIPNAPEKTSAPPRPATPHPRKIAVAAARAGGRR